MAHGPFKVHKEEANEDWLLSYADMITLLLAFFVMLLSMAKIDPVRFEQVESGVAKDIGKRDTERPIQKLKSELQQDAQKLQLDDTKVSIGSDDKGLTLEFDGGTLFAPNSAAIRADFVPALTEIFATLNSPRYDIFQLDVEGHTDDNPSQSQLYPSNWELSSGRASAVVRFFISKGMEPTRLTAIGYADTRPKVSNRDMNGKAMPVNQAINRRVMIHIMPR